MKDIIKLGRVLRKRIGAHYRMIGHGNYTVEQYDRARSDSDEAVSLVRYMVLHLDNRHMANVLADASGCNSFKYLPRI
jgi:hypothetical protein